MRADQLLVERGLAATRSQAQRLIAAGVRWRAGGASGAEWRGVVKNGDVLPEAAELELLDAAESRYVSRGGLKLEGALRASGVRARGKRCLDVGQSTGGFTDCLLHHGAAAVVGVDVGHGQLHPSLRADARVLGLEKVNARTLNAPFLIANYLDWIRDRCQFDSKTNEIPDPAFDGRFALIVGDLSFISLTLVLPALAPLLDAGGDLLMLVKPQFELAPHQIGKGGLVKDPALYADVAQRIRAACANCGLRVPGWHDSPVTGGDGNREFFLHATHDAPRNAAPLHNPDPP